MYIFFQSKCCLYYPDYENESELYFDEVDLKVTFVSEKEQDHYTQRKFELTNLLVNIPKNQCSISL